MHVYSQSKETKARTQRRATTEYNGYTGTLKRFYLMDWRHTHTFTQNPKKTEVATSLCVESFSRDRNCELPRRGPRARASRRTCWPLDSTDGVLGNERGFPALSPRSLDQRLRARSRDSRARARIKRLGRNNRLAGSKGSQGLRARCKDQKTGRNNRLTGSKGSQGLALLADPHLL